LRKKALDNDIKANNSAEVLLYYLDGENIKSALDGLVQHRRFDNKTANPEVGMCHVKDHPFRKGQVVIPAEIRGKAGLRAGQRFAATLEGDKIIFTLLPRDPLLALRGENAQMG